MKIDKKCNSFRSYPNCLKRRVKFLICIFMIILNAISPVIASAAVDSNTLSDSDTDANRLYVGGELHAFYPSNAVFSEQMQKYIDAVDSLSFAWSRIDGTDPGNLNITKGQSGNQGFYYPADYLQPVEYAKSQGKSIQLNIYMKGSDGAMLLPYEDKRAQILQAVVNSMQTDISQGEGIYYDGVVIDFEGLQDTDLNKTPILYDGKQIGTYFTQFLTDLKQQLEPLGKKLYVAVNPTLYYDGYHYREILDIADRVILMAHDYEPTEKLNKAQVEQYTGYDALEPVNSPAPIQLVRQAVQEITAAADPSELSKVWLQIAFDSAQWQFSISGADGWGPLDASTLSNQGRLTPLYQSIKARIDNLDGYGQNISKGYNNELQSPFIQYYNSKDKTWNVILYEDSSSIAAKLDLAKSSGLGGISIWSFGNMPDYNDDIGKRYQLDGWSAILAGLSEPYTKSSDSNTIIHFSDKTIEQAVREKLGKLTGNISKTDAKSIYRLYLPSGVKSLSDLKNLTNLEYLDAQQLGLKDITALGKLNNLRVLYLQRNQITDISQLKNLKHLQLLSLNGNKLTGVTPLSGLSELRELYLAENWISDISPISKLRNLRILNLGANNITKINSLSGLVNLEDLYLKENKITSISSLSSLKVLRILSLDKNRISSIKPLTGLTSLKELYLPENRVANISYLKGLDNLKVLSLNRNSIVDLKTLAQLKTLEKLYLKNNKIKDVSSLKGLINLQELYLGGNLISNYSPLSGIYPNLNSQCDFVLK